MESLQELLDDGNAKIIIDGKVDKAIEEVVRALRRAVDAAVGLDCSFAERERALLALGNESQRRLLERELQSIADAHGKNLLVNEVRYIEFRPGSQSYASLFGPLNISRHTYRQVGVRNSATAVPLELQAGLVEGATPAMAYRIALGYAKTHSRSMEEDLSADCRVPPSRTKLERLSKRIGSAAKKQAKRIEACLRQAERLPDGAAGISVGLDRTAVPMEEPHSPNEPSATRRKKRTKPYERTPPPPVDVKYHMAYVGTVSITDQYGENLIARRYAASPSEGPHEVVRSMMADVRNALRRDSRLQVGLVQDGAPEMWNLIRPALKDQAGVTVWIEAIDRYHLNERLGKVLKVIEPDASARQSQLHRWNDELDVDDHTIDRIDHRVARAIEQCTIEEDLKVLHDNATFFRNNKDRMRYVALRNAGLPVGSGATEGACRYVIGERAKRASRRWHEEGLVAALTLRSIYCSDRLPRFMTQLQRTYTADVREDDFDSDV